MQWYLLKKSRNNATCHGHRMAGRACKKQSWMMMRSDDIWFCRVQPDYTPGTITGRPVFCMSSAGENVCFNLIKTTDCINSRDNGAIGKWSYSRIHATSTSCRGCMNAISPLKMNWRYEIFMRVLKLYEKAEKPVVSFEFFPPRDEKAEKGDRALQHSPFWERRWKESPHCDHMILNRRQLSSGLKSLQF